MIINKCGKLVCNLYDNNNYVVHIRSLKQKLDNRLILRKVHRVILFNQEAWLQEYIDMNTELRKQAKNDFEKDFFKLRNNCVFGKTMENIRKRNNIKLVTTDKKRNQLVSEPNYHAIKGFSENLVAIEIKKPKVKMSKPNNAKSCYMDTDSFIIYIKTEDFYEDIAHDIEKRFDTSNYECNRPLPTGKNKKVIGLMKDELGGNIMEEFVVLRPKAYSYLMVDGNSHGDTHVNKKA